jgi:hypothetical protein
METRQYTVYKFDELKPEAKQKAIDLWYEWEEYYFLSDDLTEEVMQLDTLGIFSDIKLAYSLSNCPGDGLSFSANIDLAKWLAQDEDLTKDEKQAIVESVYKIHSTGNKGRYCYATENQIEWEGQGNETEALCAKMDTICLEIGKYYLKICKDAEDTGYDTLSYRMDGEEFSEFCESNGYMFKENGTLD